MELTLETGVRELPGIGDARAKHLEKLHLTTAADLLGYYPRDYDDRRVRATIGGAPLGQPVCIEGMVAEAPRMTYLRKGLDIIKVKIVDDTGALSLTFFNQGYVREALQMGQSYIFYGRVEESSGYRQMTNPLFEREGKTRFTGRLMPIYPLTAGISNNLLAGLTLRCVEECADLVTETLPPAVLEAGNLVGAQYACRNVHFPADEDALHAARQRLMFEELFCLACGLSLLRHRRDRGQGIVFPTLPMEPFLALLPFTLTAAQHRAMEELATDTQSGAPMNRLVQGDVGSGKTMVAAYGAWLCKQGGAQCALMVPTELLAEQHFQSLAPLLAPAGVRTALLTGATRAAEKRKLYAALAEGEIDLIIGTHALLSEGVAFCQLGLVVADEQHRFGVGQRAALSAKANLPPHVLVMSATPIPRTLALMIYGDLDVTIIDELPPGRQPIDTFVVGESKRQRMYAFVRKLVEQGRQAYIVCPMVEEKAEGGEHPGDPAMKDLKAATVYAQQLQEQIFPDLRVGMVHGKLKPREKERVMADFAAGGLDVLVSTTVIEVGVDVPNAALMVVENAERFGLSQLHQLRGRVGRGAHQSYCVLVTATRNPETRARLKVISDTTDGFKISEEDLKLRGPGDFFGARQHGLPQLRIADLAGDMRLLKQAQIAAEQLLADDPALARPEHAPLLNRVRQLFSENPDIFN